MASPGKRYKNNNNKQNAMNIHVILFLILFVSIVNLFYRSTTTAAAAAAAAVATTSPERPPPVTDCNFKSSFLLFSASGWLCPNKPFWKGDRCLACKSVHALDNASNRLIDVRTDRPVEEGNVNLFETYTNERGERVPAYRCQCASLDDRGNRMIDVVTPYECFPDYCVREIPNRPALGWRRDEGICDCGPFEHADPNDPTSPCVRNAVRYRENTGVFRGKVECASRFSFEMLPILCPNDDDDENLSFEKKIWTSKDPLDFIRKFRESQPSITYKKILNEEEEEKEIKVVDIPFDPTFGLL